MGFSHRSVLVVMFYFYMDYTSLVGDYNIADLFISEICNTNSGITIDYFYNNSSRKASTTSTIRSSAFGSTPTPAASNTYHCI